MDQKGDIAFTGTHRGMNARQKDSLEQFLRAKFEQGYRRFRHGDCVGADHQAAGIARKIGYYIIGHPGLNPKHPEDDSNRGYFPNDETLSAGPFLTRDHDMVDESEFLIAAPFKDQEELRSGTWATVRYARDKVHKPVAILYPNRALDQPLKSPVKPVRTNAIAGQPLYGPETYKRGLR